MFHGTINPTLLTKFKEGQEQSRRTKLEGLKRHLEQLKVLADKNDPLVKKRFEDGMGRLQTHADVKLTR